MEQRVRVREVMDDGTARVICIRESACSGDCHKCSGCGAAQETISLLAENPIGAKAGDLVILRSESAPVLGAAAVLYVLPLVLFFAGYFLGESLGAGVLCGCVAFLLGIVAAVAYDRRMAKKNKTVYTITGWGK